MAHASDSDPDQAAQMEAARLAIGRLVEQGLLDANIATRQLLALDLYAARQRQHSPSTQEEGRSGPPPAL